MKPTGGGVPLLLVSRPRGGPLESQALEAGVDGIIFLLYVVREPGLSPVARGRALLPSLG